MKIYVATSWKNVHCTAVVDALRAEGHEVYDFREAGFAWSQAGVSAHKEMTSDEMNQALTHPVAIDGYNRDMLHLEQCDLCVLVLPSGKSAHLEAGYASGEDKFVIVYSPGPMTPELMYKMTEGVVSSLPALIKMVRIYDLPDRG